ncbi:MAG: hypothetical protein IKK03_16100 [Lachnospiraceae bacterium]|nr:hypothetical protein [Lachnospiraceae bacterium]MBR4061350.1 hypothetical protein [Lachnospiraceae bacterium]
MKSKKNRFWAFAFSLVPGAGEMYMGFMKQGVSLMTMFFGCIMLSSWMRADVLILAGIVIWCYSFFHVHNLRFLPEEQFQVVEDKILVPFNSEDLRVDFHISNKRIRMVGACFLIFLGASMLWNYAVDIISYYLPEAFWDIYYQVCYDLPEAVVAVLIIWIGIRLIKGKKKELDEQSE